MKKLFIIGGIIFAGLIFANIIGRQAGQELAKEDNERDKQGTIDFITENCAKQPGANKEDCNCYANRVINELSSEELEKWSTDETVAQKVSTIALECAMRDQDQIDATEEEYNELDRMIEEQKWEREEEINCERNNGQYQGNGVCLLN